MSVTTPNLVIVVGSGLAGLSASSQLISHGVAVHLLERAAKPGGNSMKASSGINGAPTKYQPVLASSPDRTFFSDTLRSVGSVMGVRKEERERLIQVLTNESAAAVNWLVEDKGIDLSVVAQLGGHSYPRTHRGVGQTPPGAAIMTALLKSLQGSPLFTLETESIVTKVLKSEENGFVMGVKYLKSGEQKQLTGPVIFATGGFAGDAYGSLAKYRPDLSGFPSTNDPRPGSQKLLTDIGAQLLDMEQVQIHPTSFVDPANPGNPAKFLAAEMLRGEGGILLHAGKRFVNELETRKVVTEKIREFEGKTIDDVRVWDVQLVLDEGTYQACRSHVGFYLWKGLMKKVPISSLPSPASSLVAIRDHAFRAASSSPIDTFFSRPTFGNWTLKAEDMTSATEVYVGSVTPAVHFSMGGVIINEYAEVLDGEGEPIGEVWAAGEVTGGIHGENRLGGSSLLECVVFGRRSGDEAAKSVMGGNDGT